MNTSVPALDAAPATALASALELHAGSGQRPPQALHLGFRTPEVFDGAPQEIASSLHSASLLDLGWLGRIRVTGRDRLRWLNGMVTNAIQALAESEGNYSFLLNSQGRIKGDCRVYRRPKDLLLDTGRDQLPGLLSHLERYIIMDDVELQDVSSDWTAVALVGPKAPQILESLGISSSFSATPSGNARLSQVRIAGIIAGSQDVEVTLIEPPRILLPRYELWFAPTAVIPVWEALTRAGARPAGLRAGEVLRVLEARPLYGIDISERDLAQETSQSHALSFSKGCYLGQEIVERIRSRGKVHRNLRQFALHGSAPEPPFELHRGEQPVGRITSAVSLSLPGLPEGLALGYLRDDSDPASPKGEDASQPQSIRYEGGVAKALDAPPPLPAS